MIIKQHMEAERLFLCLEREKDKLHENNGVSTTTLVDLSLNCNTVMMDRVNACSVGQLLSSMVKTLQTDLDHSQLRENNLRTHVIQQEVRP